MNKIAKSLTELVGNTPLLELTNYNKYNQINAKILAKLEYFNPAGSLKDRVALGMILDAEEKGLLNKNSTIIEPTSGNTGIGLAFIAASRGYRLVLTMPDTMSSERISLLKALGAEVVLTPGTKGMSGSIQKAEELRANTPNGILLQQFENPAVPDIHRKTTAQELWEATDGNIDIFIAGVGTGGTLTGVGEILKERKPEIKVVAVEPYSSPVLSGGKAGPHAIQGIGAGFIPSILNVSIIDEIFQIKNEEAIETSRLLAKTEGLLVGISSGAAVFAALEIAKRSENHDKNIVTILPDTGERYLSTGLY